MKKVGIVTIMDFDNYGNRLQNYALQEEIKKIGLECITINNQPFSNTKKKFLVRRFKNRKFKDTYSHNIERKQNFMLFNNKISITKKRINPFINRFKNINTYIVGSDQVWNPYISRMREVDLLDLKNANCKIAYSASFGVEDIPYHLKEYTSRQLKKFNAISVREDKGKEIIEELTFRKDVEVLVDPTMLLTSDEWDKVSKKPKQLDNIKKDKYILNYFLGELSASRKQEIEKIAKKYNCHIINILDKKDPFYVCGPSEFLYLEKHAFLICTDSFHSSAFAIIYNKPFVIFDREQEKMNNMSSRIDTLLSKFELKDRKYNGKNITKKNIDHDYSKAYKILENERKKSEAFLRKALGIDK